MLILDPPTHQGKRGLEKPAFKLPEFIEATGITEMRSTYQEKEADKKMKQKQREKMAPKMGRMDIDYQVCGWGTVAALVGVGGEGAAGGGGARVVAAGKDETREAQEWQGGLLPLNARNPAIPAPPITLHTTPTTSSSTLTPCCLPSRPPFLPPPRHLACRCCTMPSSSTRSRPR